MTNIAKHLEKLSPEKRALVKLLLEKQKQEQPSQPVSPLIPRSGDEPVPLSFGQQRLWFLDQLASGLSYYNEFEAVKLKGKLNIKALQRSLSEITRRHEALRTVIDVKENHPRQQINAPSEVALPIVDLRSLQAGQRNTTVHALAMAEAKQPFDLTKGPLLRVLLLKLDAVEHTLFISMHHIISDGWSRSIFIRELVTFYTAYCRGQQPALPEPPIQYADFAMWQRQWLQGERLESQLTYWKKQLADITMLQLPGDHPRPVKQTFEGLSYSFTVPPQLAASLKTLGRRENATLFMVLLSALNILLYHYTGQTDIAVGVPIANRNHSKLEDVIGFFVNTLVLRTNLSRNPRYSDLLKRVRQVTLDAYAHQDLPFEKLVEELQPQRNLSRNPLFQVMFVLQNTPAISVQLPNLTLQRMKLERGIARADLLLTMTETKDALTARLEYNTDLFNPDSAARLATHYQNLLASIAADPEQPLSDLSILTEAERHRLLVTWNETKTDYPQTAVHELFEARAAQTPEAVALVYDDGHLTYAQLNRRANQLAHYLRAQGVEPGQSVGICMARSVEMLVSTLGVLKVGGIYVPLDPTYPPERLSFMLKDMATMRDDGAAVVVVTLQEIAIRHGLTHLHAGPIICLDRDQDAIVRQRSENPSYRIPANAPAYVMYTSGSTGRPKGIIIPHLAIGRLVLNTDYVALSASDRIAHLSNVSFDAATFEIWGAFLNSACLVLMPREVILSPHELANQLDRDQVSTLFITTALFNQLVQELPSCFRSVTHLLFGGEAVDPESVRRVLRSQPPQRLLHVYGPTEGTTYTTWYPIPEVSDEATTVPIGRPIANTQVYLLDAYLQPTPVGVPGELYIGGEGLARNYLNQPGLTAKKFIPHPFSSTPGDRLYRSGDQARYLPDGNIEFLGRLDRQVKIRGFRIELGEIQATLTQHPLVQEALTITQDHPQKGRQLIAYIKTNELAPIVSELRHFLGTKLPDYMVPSAYVMMTSFPITANGKIDRQALPLPTSTRPQLANTYQAPLGKAQKQLATIWQDLLSLDEIGVNDNFFDLGGHSLLVVELQRRLQDTFAQKVPLTELFKRATIAAQAEFLAPQDTTPQTTEEMAAAVQARAHKRRLSRQQRMHRQRPRPYPQEDKDE